MAEKNLPQPLLGDSGVMHHATNPEHKKEEMQASNVSAANLVQGKEELQKTLAASPKRTPEDMQKTQPAPSVSIVDVVQGKEEMHAEQLAAGSVSAADIEQGKEETRAEKLAASNVRKAMTAFLMLDFFVVMAFASMLVTGLVPEGNPLFSDPEIKALDQNLAFKWLPAVIIFTFSVDIILALRFLNQLNQDAPDWAGYREIVRWNFVTNVVSLVVLCGQRLAYGLWMGSIPAFGLDILCVILRIFKLRPLYFLKKLVGSTDPSGKELTYWSHEHAGGWYERILKWSCIFFLIVVIGSSLLIAMLSFVSEPMGMPPPHLHPRPVKNVSLRQLTPFMLASSLCDEDRCKVDEKWYFCNPAYCHDACVTPAFQPLHAVQTVSVTGGPAAAAGAGIAALFGPEFIPVGAAIGGALGAASGTVIVVYEVAGDKSCLSRNDEDLPETAKEMLWCAKHTMHK